jgi:competence protein ComEA
VMERKQRLVLWLLSVFLGTALLYSGHEADHKGVPVAFLHYTSRGNTVRLKGCVPNPGIYRFPDHSRVATVINMTAPSIVGKVADKTILEKDIQDGEIIEAVAKDREHIELTIYKMRAKERMLLGIPLVPDQMDFADWDALPGIGPELAKTIMDNRQENGGFGSFGALQRVPGIGEKKLKELKRYF